MRLSVLKLIIFYVFRLNIMKKTYIFIATVIVCCLFLWIGFYAGWSSKTVTNGTSTSTLGQAECLGMYPLVKEYITDHYEYDPIEWIDPSNSTVGDIDIRYNSDSGGCYASTTVYYVDYLNIWDIPKQNLTRSYIIFSIWDGIEITYRCDSSNNDITKNCIGEFQLKKDELKKSS